MGKQKGRAYSSGMAASLVPHAQGAVPTVGFGGYHGAVRVEPAAPSDPDSPIRLTPESQFIFHPTKGIGPNPHEFRKLSENLKLTAQALSDKATPMDELEDMHQRENDWHFVFHMVFKCIESSALLVEEMTDGINDAIINQVSSEDVMEKLKLVVSTTDKLTLSLAESALVTLCHLNLGNLQEAEKSQSLQLIRSGDYAENTNKMVESILRLFLASGVSEAIAKSFGEEASSMIGSSCHAYLHFWELVASSIKNASPQIRRSTLESMELWGLTKGSVSGLFLILLSSQPIFHLQLAVFSLLLSEPFSQLSLLKDSSLDISQSAELMPDSEKTLCLRDELSALVEFPTSELLKQI
ncbi:E3 ubiquitin-protein ligase listerin [Dichanthelium oligosanthes]|uniref:E3 ubiquitin-protein ligase listerin n=1 Tax=Dichanthelium oligosanthes TaxID=888268 RepID=A0A1E5WL40_9POAL|nr:E3 ubiquitin-protein ligase listerin [Dichanthelium oligosanthes]